MHVERQIGDPANCFHHRNTNADIRNKVAVHHVQMKDPRPGVFQAADFAFQVPEVGGQQRRDHQRPSRPQFSGKSRIAHADTQNDL